MIQRWSSGSPAKKIGRILVLTHSVINLVCNYF
jgi:hypothetical protein